MGVHPRGEKSGPSEGSVYDAAHVAAQLLGMRDGGECGGEEILVPCPHVGTFGAREDCDGRQGRGGHGSMGARLGSDFGVGWV